MSGLRVQILEDPESVVEATAHTIRRRLIRSLGRTGTARLALSGGSTGTDLAHALAAGGPVGGAVDWSRVEVWQVDERVAPTATRTATPTPWTGCPGRVHPMPVTADDLEVAAVRYADGLPDRFDVVHLGMGPDGHTASWPPGDPIVDLPPERRVALSRPYQGRVRMSLLPGPVNAGPRPGGPDHRRRQGRGAGGLGGGTAFRGRPADPPGAARQHDRRRRPGGGGAAGDLVRLDVGCSMWFEATWPTPRS